MTTLATTALTGLFLWSPLATAGVALAEPIPAPPEPVYPTYLVGMTAYNAVPEQTDGDPHITASGAFSDPDIVAARTVDLADELPFGTVIEVMSGTTTPACGFDATKDRIGLRVIADSMNSRLRNKIDILFAPDDYVHQGGRKRSAARALGMCKNIQIRVVGTIDISHMPRNQEELKQMLGIEEQKLAVNN